MKVNSKISINSDETGTSIPVMEAFYTIQGEGYYQGSAAYFIRLGGCDVGCHWCDVKESWDASLHPLTSVEDLIQQSSEHPSEIVVITGGEPLMYNLHSLTTALKKAGKRTHLETSGAHPLTGSWDWICLSPKKFKLPLEEIYSSAHELKMIIYNKADFAWAKKEAEKVSPGCKLYIQPEWSKAEQMLPVMIDFVKDNPKWEISLQLHKYLNIP